MTRHDGEIRNVRENAAAQDRCGCGAPADDISFDRSICACGSMHYFCAQCGRQAEPCSDEQPAATTESRPRFWAAHKRLSFFRDRWRLRREPDDPRPWFEASIIFQARDMAQAEFLFERMTDDALDCNRHGPDEPCPHFRVGGLHQMDEGWEDR